MQTILLAGGLGSRLAEETVAIPKPMVEVGGRPIITRVMDIYSQFGHNDFIVAAGYKSLSLKQYFANYHLIANNISVSLDSGKMDLVPVAPGGWNVSVVDTGPKTMTSGRIRRLKEWLKPGPFMVTYSDGVGNIDINALIDFHKSHGKLATVTAVQPPARFGNIELAGDRVEAFTEKVRRRDTWINGGFFVFEPEVMDYFVDDMEPLEQSPLTQMAQDCELMAYRHDGFWHPMDTIRDRNTLNELCEEETPPWMRFNEELPNDITALAI
ncbi:glucose-1-phosphate cytidylyltransferase [Aliiroseovarius halocynthiae]|uniref:Glucose-1-phosphate cytidylyltransferase n=1 Tax=Aliiroseovarius halocynthiae TaxID=985055 RepID=A0A545SUK5_9RHOB|nr:glucose-1-phosphate cytidylyltransferase [Aliiroseovarius halocynthiae]TQV68646.1 glucose-1-phosphate cytidylyltransferase [Aliiroseovarius halocynthiae]SMR71065.1 glucose-1-phosphate cytidylyltransferase [Aliiroseovarius halocynthiae]